MLITDSQAFLDMLIRYRIAGSKHELQTKHRAPGHECFFLNSLIFCWSAAIFSNFCSVDSMPSLSEHQKLTMTVTYQ